MDKPQKKFLASLSALLAKMAMADGVVTVEERCKVLSILNELGLNREQREYCTLAFEIAEKDGVPLRRYVQESVATRFGIDARELLYNLMWDVACADGILHKGEKALLEELQNELGLSLDSYDLYYRRYVLNGRLAKDETVRGFNLSVAVEGPQSRLRPLFSGGQ